MCKTILNNKFDDGGDEGPAQGVTACCVLANAQTEVFVWRSAYIITCNNTSSLIGQILCCFCPGQHYESNQSVIIEAHRYVMHSCRGMYHCTWNVKQRLDIDWITGEWNPELQSIVSENGIPRPIQCLILGSNVVPSRYTTSYLVEYCRFDAFDLIRHLV